MTDVKADADSGTCPLHIDLRDPHARATIYGAYAAMREREPVAPAILTVSDQDDLDFSGTLGREVFLATTYDAALETLTDDRFSLDRLTMMTPEQRAALPPMPDAFRPLLRNLLSLDPPDHTRLRRLVQPTFTPRGLEAWRPRIQAIADELIDAAEAAAAARGETTPNRTMDVVEAFAYPLPMTVIAELIGVPPEDRAQVRAWSEELIASQAPTPEMGAVLDAFAAYLRELFAEKRDHPTDDLTSALVRVEEAGDRLDDDELLSMVFILIVAGHITTVNLIGNIVIALLNHPDQCARIRANPDLVPNAVEETLRFWSPVEMAAPRTARDDVQLCEAAVPRGGAVFPVLASANRDRNRFADPDRFDIERSDANRHVAFGKGIHLCLGAPLARIEGQVATSTLLRRLPEMQLADPIDAPPLQVSFLRGPARLDLLF